MATSESLVERLRKRAAIRRKITCRGPEDRLSKDLEDAADALEDAERQITVLREDLALEIQGL